MEVHPLSFVSESPHYLLHDAKRFERTERHEFRLGLTAWLDNSGFNRRPRVNNLRAVENTRIFDDYKVAAEILDRHQAIIRKKNNNARFVFLEGNHEERMERYINANPACEGMLEVPIALELKRRGVEWIPYWSKGTVCKIGKATFIHGRYCTDHHAKKHVQSYGCSVFYGHVHDVQAYSAVTHGATLIGQSLGCLCLPQRYLQGHPDRWQQAVAIFEFLPDGNFQYQVLRIVDHKFSYDNKIYHG